MKKHIYTIKELEDIVKKEFLSDLTNLNGIISEVENRFKKYLSSLFDRLANGTDTLCIEIDDKIVYHNKTDFICENLDRLISPYIILKTRQTALGKTIKSGEKYFFSEDLTYKIDCAKTFEIIKDSKIKIKITDKHTGKTTLYTPIKRGTVMESMNTVYWFLYDLLCNALNEVKGLYLLVLESKITKRRHKKVCTLYELIEIKK